MGEPVTDYEGTVLTDEFDIGYWLRVRGEPFPYVGSLEAWQGWLECDREIREEIFPYRDGEGDGHV